MNKLFFSLLMILVSSFSAYSQARGKVKYYVIGHAIKGHGICANGVLFNEEIEMDAGDYNIHRKMKGDAFYAKVSDPIFAERNFALVKTNQCLLVYSVTRKYSVYNNCETTTYFTIIKPSFSALKKEYEERKVRSDGKRVCSECTYNEIVWWPGKDN